MLLQPDQLTIATEARDYPEWHHGRPYYALWYVEIQQPELLNYLQQLRQHFSALLLQPNTRQFHITVFICGFWRQGQLDPIGLYHDDFQLIQFQQQCRAIQQNVPIALQLRTGKINSFESALMLDIFDSQAGLTQLKTILAQHGHEVAALAYCPHITLGLYADQFAYADIQNLIAQVEQKSFQIHVDKLHFGYYSAQQLQGELYSQYHIELEQACCNLS